MQNVWTTWAISAIFLGAVLKYSASISSSFFRTVEQLGSVIGSEGCHFWVNI